MNDDALRYPPGTHDCHEALHMAHVLGELVSDRLIDHPAIAGQAHGVLFARYHAIGRDHLEVTAP